MSTINLWNVECLEFMKGMEDNSVDAIVTDPPYFGVKDDDWDNQWKNADHFIEWIGELSEQWQRILKPNGSLYCFASPRMAARVEVKISDRFEVLNRIRWTKGEGWHQKAEKEALRSYLSPWEEVIFAEHYNSDSIAKGEAGYAAKCDQLRGFVFEPLRAYLDGERIAAGLSREQVDQHWQRERGTKGVMTPHWFGVSQFGLPTQSNYEFFQRIAPGYFQRQYEELRQQYEELRQQYEELRRPFNVTAEVPYTDVWTFRTVQAYEGKHVCEKPLALMEHIILASTRPDALVFDPFAGSGSTGIAAILNGRRFLGCEKDPTHYRNALKRIKKAQSAPRLFTPEPVPVNVQTSIEDAE